MPNRLSPLVLALPALLLFAVPARAGEPGDSWFVPRVWDARLEGVFTQSGSGKFGAQYGGSAQVGNTTGARVSIGWAPRSRFVHYQFSYQQDTAQVTARMPSLFGAANPLVKLGRATRSSPRLAIDYHPFRDERWDYNFGFGLQRDSYSFSQDGESASYGISNVTMSGGTRFALHTGVDFIFSRRLSAGLSVRWSQNSAAIDADILAAGATAVQHTSSAVKFGTFTVGLGANLRF